ncbi:MAG: exodeoxyribonuclease VII small subunit [Acidobacteria bacterium]|nr:exodeoxyribonuclease VII small subunit [Acidobacteriota bacterium]
MAKRERVTTESVAAEAQAPGFEGQLATLERIVRELERGDLPLERSLELFEQGVRLSRECQERLNEAERRIEVLLRSGDGATTTTLQFGADELEAEAAVDGDEDESVF